MGSLTAATPSAHYSPRGSTQRPTSRAGQSGRLFMWGALVLATAAGALGARHPALFGLVGLVVVGTAAAAFAHARPASALTGALFLLPVATTKFRARSATASISGEVDAQVMFELGLYALIGLSSVAAASSRSFRWRRLTAAEMLLAMYAMTAVSSGLWSTTPMLSVVKGGQLVILLLLCLVATRVIGAEHLVDTAAKAVVPYVLVCAALAALFPWASNHVSTGASVGRFAWFYVHPITAASYAGIAAMSVYLQRRYGMFPRRSAGALRAALLVLVLVAILLLTRSRGPMIAMVMALALAVVHKRMPRWLVAASGAAVLALAAIYVNSGTSWIEWLSAHSGATVAQFLLRGQAPQEIAEFSGRGELWKGATALFTASPIVGYGYGGARGLLLDAVPWAGDAHNAMIQSVLDVGLLGSIPLWVAVLRALAIATIARSGRGRPQSYTGALVLGFLAFVVVNSVTDVGFTEPGYVFVLMAGCVVAADRLRPGRTRWVGA